MIDIGGRFQFKVNLESSTFVNLIFILHCLGIEQPISRIKADIILLYVGRNFFCCNFRRPLMGERLAVQLRLTKVKPDIWPDTAY